MKVAVLGARGLIGKNLLYYIEEKWSEVLVDCFGQSENAAIHFRGKNLPIYALDSFDPSQYDFIFSALDSDVTLSLKEKIEKSNAFWIDKSSALRMDDDVPLIVPEINFDTIGEKRIIASPNCVVIPVAIFLHAIAQFDIQFVNLTTYQSVSGAGRKALDAFYKEIKMFSMKNMQDGFLYEHPMAFNVIPAIGEIDEDENCDEEIKITQELRKILGGNYTIAATCARVPVSIGHMAVVNFSLKSEVKKEQLLSVIEKSGIIYSKKIVTPIIAAHEDNVFACRLRYHGNKTWSIILICDNLRKGGALNAFEIAERLKK